MADLSIGIIIFIVVLIIALTIMSVLYVMEKQYQATFQQERINMLNNKENTLNNREKNINQCEKCSADLQQCKKIQQMIHNLSVVENNNINGSFVTSGSTISSINTNSNFGLPLNVFSESESQSENIIIS
ncbi:MAG: hypothetical protein Terrestrivirus3_218 [Terrestrivirus sp.]|uniref:Uncharacterized protein n=1 Tax=Terrestrivirus sp. TaxID=2487775 RepID=A0A3G4ZR95_9VIRU|nr:MAG: hypothetical protein Terrestrivirus3_218 [Terrestrivirus sp.]